MFIQKKEYEKPDSGLFHGVLADIVDLGNVTTNYQGQSKTQPMVRFVWILAVNGKDGKPLSVSKRYNVSNLHEKANVYKDLKMILGVAPTPALDIESLIGQTRKLWINREKSPDGIKDFANIVGYLPADPGVAVPIPADFIRAKFRPQTTAGPQGQSVQTYQQPPQPVVAAATQAYTPPPNPQYGQTVSSPQGADVKF